MSDGHIEGIVEEAQNGDLDFYQYEVKRVTSRVDGREAESGEVGQKIACSVQEYEYRLGNANEAEQTVKWAVKIGDEENDLPDTGERIELEIKPEWSGKYITIMPYIIECSEDVGIKIWCHILRHRFLRDDAVLNRIAAGETVNHDDNSHKTICEVLNTLTESTDSLLTVEEDSSMDSSRIVSCIKLFQYEYMDEYKIEKREDQKYEGDCPGIIDQDTVLAMDKALRETGGWKIKWRELDGYTDGQKKKPMIVRVFGRGSRNAVLLIGGLHSDEVGGMRAIKIMKNYMKLNPIIIPTGTTVFVLNPASVTWNRYINGLDPNRQFMTYEILNETHAIIGFISYLLENHDRLTIISAHSYTDSNDEVTGRVSKNGIVFPLYNLTDLGREKARKKEAIEDLTNLELYYSIPPKSREIRELFHNATGFKEMDLFDYKPIVGELLYYLDDYYFYHRNLAPNKSLNMVEFETPKSEEVELANGKRHADNIETSWGSSFRSFLFNLLWRVLNNA
jgi:hypothetical protein